MNAVPTLDLRACLRGRRTTPSWALWDLDELPPLLDVEVAARYPERDLSELVLGFEDELAGRIDRHGAYHGVADFLAQADGLDNLRDRRAFVVTATHLARMRNLPRLPLPPNRATTSGPRRLRDLEVVALRTASRDPRRTVLLQALAAGCCEVEFARIASTHAEIDGEDVLIALPGGRGIRPRTILLPDCAYEVALLQSISRDGWLLPAGPDPAVDPRHQALHRTLRGLLKWTGFAADRAVTVASIRLTGLHNVAESFGFQAAAEVAGTTSWQRLHRQLAV